MLVYFNLAVFVSLRVTSVFNLLTLKRQLKLVASGKRSKIYCYFLVETRILRGWLTLFLSLLKSGAIVEVKFKLCQP